MKQKENDAKQLQNVLFHATYRSYQRQTRPTDDSSHAYPLLRSLHRTSFPNDTCNENLKALTEQVRNSEDIRTAKASLLPYVTPCGTFTRRSSKDFVSPSHLVIVDVDGLHSYQEAVEMRRMLYDDPLLQPVLTFVSPSGLGVKAFVPCHYSSTTNDIQNITDNMSWAMRYVETAYNTVTAVSSETKSKVDFSGKDLVRSCFLSYDPEALFRTTNK